MWKSTLLSSRQVFLNDKYSCQHSQHHFYPPPQQQQEQLQDNTFLAVFHGSSSTQIHFSFLTSLFANKYECIKLHHHPWRGYPLKVTWFFWAWLDILPLSLFFCCTANTAAVTTFISLGKKGSTFFHASSLLKWSLCYVPQATFCSISFSLLHRVVLSGQTRFHP